MSEKNFSKAKEYVTDSYISRIEYLEEKAREHPESLKVGPDYMENERYELLEEADGKARVLSKATLKSGGTDFVVEVLLIKQDGKWLINDAIPKK
jgi:hypothetical protein